MKKGSFPKTISAVLPILAAVSIMSVLSGCTAETPKAGNATKYTVSSSNSATDTKKSADKMPTVSSASPSKNQEETAEISEDTAAAEKKTPSADTEKTVSASPQNTGTDQKTDPANAEKQNDSKTAVPNAGTDTNQTSAVQESTQNAVVSSPQNTTDAAAPADVHTHKWTEHTAKRWHENIVTVIDEPEQRKSYTLYRIYWYNTGSWEETRDPDRFSQWNHDMSGGPLSPNSINMATVPENCPLFNGYNSLGQPTYTNDHVVITGLYDLVPAVTHEEDQGWYEEYVDYIWCPECGAKKES